MTWKGAWLARIHGVFRRRSERDLDAEMQAHLDLLTEQYAQSGLSPHEARAAAQRAFGGVMQIKESYRDQRHWATVGHLSRDMRHGFRALRRNPGFTVVAIVTLALGIGVNAAVFSFANALLFRPLPVRDADRLTVFAKQRRDGSTITSLSPQEFDLLRAKATRWSHFVAASEGMYVLVADGTTDRVEVSFVTENYWDAFGLHPSLGTFFSPFDSAKQEGASSIVLAYDYWQQHFRGDRTVVGKTISLGGVSLTITGVSPRGFRGDSVFSDVKGFVPRSAPGFLAASRPSRVLGFLNAGTTLEQANASLEVISTEMARARRESPTEARLSAVWERLARPTPHAARPEMSSAVFFGLLAVLVLGLACVNVASLILIRLERRRAELAVRAALGASRRQLAWHVFIETCLLVTMAGGVGLILGEWITVGVGDLLPTPLAGFARQLSFDWRAGVFVGIVVCATALIVGMAPAFRAARPRPESLRRNGPSVAGGRAPIRRALMVLQIAAALVLLVVSGLLARSLASTRALAFGFDPRGVFDFGMNPAEGGDQGGHALKRLEVILDRVGTLPGVESAALSQSVPLTSLRAYSSARIYPDNFLASATAPDDVGYSAVSPTYFDALRIAIRAGRAFSKADTSSAPRVAIVNAAMASHYWPDTGALGKTFRLNSDSSPSVEVVGIVGNILNYSPTQDVTTPLFFLPLDQHPTPSVTLQLRSTRPAGSIVPDVREMIRREAPDLVLFNVQTMTEAINEAPNGLFLSWLGSWLATGVGVLGLILSVVGVYGVVAYGASQRTRELALMMALGATPGHVRRKVISLGLSVVLGGLALGVGLAAALSQLTANLYFGVSPLDPLTFVGATLLVGTAALTACYVPAHRAMRINPVTALKDHE